MRVQVCVCVCVSMSVSGCGVRVCQQVCVCVCVRAWARVLTTPTSKNSDAALIGCLVHALGTMMFGDDVS